MKWVFFNSDLVRQVSAKDVSDHQENMHLGEGERVKGTQMTISKN